jgi:hypothetical protein
MLSGNSPDKQHRKADQQEYGTALQQPAALQRRCLISAVSALFPATVGRRAIHRLFEIRVWLEIRDDRLRSAVVSGGAPRPAQPAARSAAHWPPQRSRCGVGGGSGVSLASSRRILSTTMFARPISSTMPNSPVRPGLDALHRFLAA